MELSETQQAILALIAERVESDGVPPSQAEIANAFGFSGVRAAQYHLEVLEAGGLHQAHPGPGARHPPGASASDGCRRARNRLAPVAGRRTTTMCCACRCWAGLRPACRSAPISARDDVVLLDRSFFSPTPDYLLKVKGDSMRDDGIFDGDLIGVHRTSDAQFRARSWWRASTTRSRSSC